MIAGQGNSRIKPCVTNQSLSLPEDLDRHILRDYPLSQVYPYVNKQMLFGHHLGMKGNIERLLLRKTLNDELARYCE